MQNRDSTTKVYLSVWRQFNAFLVRLDAKPKFWEDRTTLFVMHLMQRGLQSVTIKSYVSVIKFMLVLDGYDWQDGKILVTALSKACKVVNDILSVRLPIHCGLPELILFELQRKFEKQWYLEVLYKAIFIISYYGLLREGEVTKGPHAIRMANIAHCQ